MNLWFLIINWLDAIPDLWVAIITIYLSWSIYTIKSEAGVQNLNVLGNRLLI
jgi:hypothetical protein